MDGNTISTEYSLKSSDFVVLNGISQSVGYPNELVLDPYSDLQELSIPQSPYNFLYSCVNNVVGDNDNRLRVLQKSPSGKELKASIFLNSSDDTIVEFNKFKNDSVFGREVNSLIINQIRNSSIQIEYYHCY